MTEFIKEFKAPEPFDRIMSVLLGLAAIGMAACLAQLAINKKRG